MISGIISVSLFLTMAILAVILWVVLWVGKKFIPMVFHVYRYKHKFVLWTLRIETIVWLFYILYTIYILFNEDPGFIIILIALILILGRELWRDFIPGLIFRVQGIAHPGDHLIHEGDICRIESLGNR